MRIRFRNAVSGLRAKPLPPVYELSTLLGQTARLVRNSPNSELQGFQICGEDHHWVWADARIEGQTMVVDSSQIAKPIAVRYGWADNPTVNLANEAGLTAAPFRTDSFAALTANRHF